MTQTMQSMVSAVLTLSGLGALFGVMLAIASKKFCVATDPRLDEIIAKLPGANCGACGKPGCMGFAEALIQGTCSIESCVASKDETRKDVARILGQEVGTTVAKKAVLQCHGGSQRVKDKYVYSGIRDCIAASQIMGGPKACQYGCIGFGSCVKACPFGALTMGDDGLPSVIAEKCNACGKCVAICPKKLFVLIPRGKKYIVRCKSHDLGKKVMDVCSAGCIGCRKCEKACPIKAIKVADNLSVIDYALCDNRGDCMKACPTKTIFKTND